MLKITRESTTQDTRLHLEGQVAGQWVDELRKACDEALCAGSGRPVLDLQEVSFIDGAGLQLFRELWDRVAVTNCSLFAAELLKDVSSDNGMVRS
jgi:anti-anti-sigma factor